MPCCLCWPGLSWSEPKTTVSMSVSGHKKKVSGCKTNKQLQEIRLAPLHSHTQDPQDLEEPKAPLDQLERWDDLEFQECLDQRVTGVSPDVLEKMVSVESRDSRER